MTGHRAAPPRSRQSGQAIVVFALMIVLLLTGVGVAIDASAAYYWNAAAERAAAAAALSGVIFMPEGLTPAQATPAGSGNDATDRAIAEARRNRFDTADTADNVQVVAAAVPGRSNQLQVTVSRTVPALFLTAFGLSSYVVQRTAVASYLPPLAIGQAGNQLGATVPQVGANGAYYMMEIQGWQTDRENGDAFSPNPGVEYEKPLSPASGDIHQINGLSGGDTVDGSLPARGGYNYRVTLASPGSIQVYNAVEGPDDGKQVDNCDNGVIGGGKKPACSDKPKDAYYEGAVDGDLSTPSKYSATEYTLFQVHNQFIRGIDTEIAQFKVLPIDASGWKTGTYRNVNTGATITQVYNPDGTAANMLIFHNWADVSAYAGLLDGGLVQRRLTYGTGLLPAGTYRLRVDSLNFDGSNPPGSQQSYKDYAVRAVDASGNPCSDCAVAAWNDMAFSTPISTPGGGSFGIPLFQLPPDYAGQTLTVDIYDPGDVAGDGNVDINILDNTGAIATTPGLPVDVYDLGVSRTGTTPTLVGTPSQATFRAVSGGKQFYNGHWLEMQIPVSAAYAPGPNPASWYWQLQYVTSKNVEATDTLTVAVGIHGVPARLISG